MKNSGKACAGWCVIRCQAATILSAHRITDTQKMPEAGCSTGSVTPMDLTFARQVMCSQFRMRTSSNLPSIIQTNVKNSAPRNLSLIGKSMPRSQPPAKNGWIAMHSESASGRLSPTLWSILESLPMRCAYSATT